MAKLNSDEIANRLKALPGWKYEDNAIRKQLKFKQFMDGIGFINRIAKIAEAADHHPDMTINYTRILFSCSTHDQGGVTEKDFKLAENIEREFKQAEG